MEVVVVCVVVKGLEKIDVNNYREIVIRDTDEGYLIDIRDNNSSEISESNLESLSIRLDGMDDGSQIIEFIKKYLEYGKINGTTGIRIRHNDGICMYALGDRKLLLEIAGSDLSDELRSTVKMVENKYIQDRYDFCYKNEGIKSFKIDVTDYISSYGIRRDKLYYQDKGEEEEIIYLNLRHSKNGLIPSEYRFISEFIIDIFSRFDEEIKIVKVLDTDYEYTKFVSGYVLKCRDIRIYFPRYLELLWIFGLVNKYNNELNSARESVKKRQLKMEGF